MPEVSGAGHDFWHLPGSPKRRYPDAMWDAMRLLRLGGLLLWLSTLLPLSLNPEHRLWDPAGLLGLGWTAPYLAFGFSYWWATDLRRRRRERRIWTLVTSGCGLALIGAWPSATDLSLLLVLSASVLPSVVRWRAVVLWTAAQTLGMGALQAGTLEVQSVVLNALYMGVVQIVVATLVYFVDQERVARAALQKAHSELQLTQFLLAEASREAERMHIARDLHDALGHHLTVLGLELEVLGHQTQGAALDTVGRAKGVNRRLLGDLRGAVSRLRAPHLDLHDFASTLRGSVPGLGIHIDLPETLSCTSPPLEAVVMRFMQECLTNSVRHARARQVWLSVSCGAGEVRVRARDDGHLRRPVQAGHGLRGLTERFEEAGGWLRWEAVEGRLHLEGVLPAARATGGPGA